MREVLILGYAGAIRRSGTFLGATAVRKTSPSGLPPGWIGGIMEHAIGEMREVGLCALWGSTMGDSISSNR